MKISPELTFKLKQLLLIIIYWVTMVRFIILLEYWGYDNALGGFPETKFFSILRQNMIAGTAGAMLVGLSTGWIELFIFKKYLQNKSFFRLLMAKLLVYLVCISVIAGITAFVYLRYYKGHDSLEAAYSIWALLNTNGFYTIFLLGFLLSLGINFVLIMQNKIGIGNFLPILLGRYHRPKEENRIFLFIDLKSSTLAAEQLGHEQYSRMIQDCFMDLSELVIRYRGIIYQFVGDEGVITWKTNRQQNFANSIRLFFAFQKSLDQKGDYYRRTYKVTPRFKGAINAGKVMVAEVGGSIKTEIAFHGDVLNTASRMLELCKSFDKDLVISESVSINITPGILDAEIELLSQKKLRGKSRENNFFSVTQRASPPELIGD